MTPDIALAISVELAHIIKSDWRAEEFLDHFLIIIPKPALDREVIDEIWRVARFVGYSSFISIEQSGREKVILKSRLPSGDGFMIEFVASP
jgi:hypothetical protein